MSGMLSPSAPPPAVLPKALSRFVAGGTFPRIRRAPPLGIALLLVLLLIPGAALSQVTVTGRVQDATTLQGVPDVSFTVVGAGVHLTSDPDGRFVLADVPPGSWTLRIGHIAYGIHEERFSVEEGESLDLKILLSPEAVTLEAVVVEVESRQARRERAQGFSLQVVDREQIVAALGSSRHLGDLIRQTVPGLRLRQANNLVGTEVCLEFRGASTMSLLETRACSHPLVYLDGVAVTDPTTLYGMVGLQMLQRIQVVPPSEAGARYGTGALYGVILIETARPGREGPGGQPVLPLLPARPGSNTHDWSGETASHPGLRTFLAAGVGSSIGLWLGLAAAGRCIGVDEKDQVVSECGVGGNALAVATAFALPAFAGALGARWAGSTDASRGRLAPALIGAGLALFPGYAFSLSTVGSGSEAANVAGALFLVLGTPALVTVADRLFRDRR
jgi:hypothetical protein